MTATRTEVAEETPPGAAPTPARGLVGWVTSIDHKPIGISYIYTALLFVLAALVGVLGQRVELFSSGPQLLRRPGDLQFTTMYLSAIFFLVMGPLFVGLATYLLPLQIGSSRPAFPRLHALAYWVYLAGGVLVVVSYLTRGGPFAAQSLVAPPGAALGGRASDLWLLGMGAVSAAAVLAAIGFIATLVTKRADGLTMERLPMFSWSTLVASALVIIATPVFMAGLVVVYGNLHHGGRFFENGKAAIVVWRHLSWINGRPELFALLIMGAGVLSEVVPTFVRRRLLAYRPALGLLGAMGALALLVWAYNKQAVGAPLAPTFSVAATLVFLPLAALVLMWLGTLATGRPRPGAALAFAAGFVISLAVAFLGLLSAALVHVRGGSAWAEGHNGLLLVAPPLFALSAAAFYWGPKVWGRHLSEGLGYLQFLLMLGGFLLAFVPYYLGLRDFPRFATDTSGGFTFWNWVVTLGYVLIVLAYLVFLVNLAKSVWAKRGREASEDPWEGATLEWLAPSPPPPHNFDLDTVPEIRSEQPVLDMRRASQGGVA